MSEPGWLILQDVIDINSTMVAATGEPFEILDLGKLEGALGRTANTYYYNEVEDVLKLAVLTMVAIANAHAFMQGNKRSGFAAGHMFLRNNGYRLLENIDTHVDDQGDPYVALLLIDALSEAEDDLLALEDYLSHFVVPIEESYEDYL